MPVAAIKQLLDPFQLALTHRVCDVGFMNDHTLHRHDPVIEGGARIVVGTPGSDQVNRLPTGRARAHPLEIVTRHAIVEIGVGQEQMLIQPTGH